MRWEGRSAILAVEEVAHGLSASFVRFFQGFAFVGVHALLGRGGNGIGLAARGAAIGEAGFIGLQLELCGADGAHSDGKRHPANMIQRTGNSLEFKTMACQATLYAS